MAAPTTFRVISTLSTSGDDTIAQGLGKAVHSNVRTGQLGKTGDRGKTMSGGEHDVVSPRSIVGNYLMHLRRFRCSRLLVEEISTEMILVQRNWARS
jgi:hypothetical protein